MKTPAPFSAIPSGSILGVNYSGAHDSSIAVVSPSGEPVFACSLERVTREKQDGRPPKELLEAFPWDRISCVAISTDERSWTPSSAQSKLHPVRFATPREGGLVHGPQFLEFVNSLPGQKIFVCHQLSHAASAFWPSGFEDALVLTYDGGMHNSPWFGGLYRGSRQKGIAPLDMFPASGYAKITTLYTTVTAMLGFTPNKHEGKITGLAAYGKPVSACRAELDRLFVGDYSEIEEVAEWLNLYSENDPPLLTVNEEKRRRLRERFAGISDEDMAATIQNMAEEHVLAILDNAKKAGWTSESICLAGGLFANVKINQRVREWGFKKIFISPSMTDDGTALGAALHAASKGEVFNPPPHRNVFWGYSFSGEEIEKTLSSHGVVWSKIGDPAGFAVDRLIEGKVVAVFQGAMEFGPRALGNRSIIAPATTKEINKELNDRLARTEFMPFAPITRIEDSADCYKNIEGAEYAAGFMTITFDCHDVMKNLCPAVVHVDGTARPQFVAKETHPLIHDMLTRYRERTGAPALVNTSFNVHEEPIVCSPEDAMEGFLESGLDYLVFEGGYVAEFTANKEAALRRLIKVRRSSTRKERIRNTVIHELFRRMEAQIESLEAKEEFIQRQVALLKDKESALHGLGAQLLEKDALIVNLNDQLLEKDSLITSLNTSTRDYEAQLVEKDALIVNLNDQLLEKDTLITSLNASTRDYEAQLVEKDALISNLHTISNDHQRQLVEKEALIAQLSTMLNNTLSARLQAKLDSLKAVPPKAKAMMKNKIARLKALFDFISRPRLGSFFHYQPREIMIPSKYQRAAAPSNPPRISIVTPSYGQGKFIERTMKSVLDQNYPTLEYIVQDGGSKDETVEVLRRYNDRLKFWESVKDKGQTNAINLGFRHATGDIMAWLNSDDILLPGALNYVVSYFDRHPEVDVVYGHRVIIDEQDREVGRWVMPPHDNEILSWADYVPQETLFWRRSIWEKAGGYVDESFHFAMDWDFLVRLRDAGAVFRRLPRFLGGFRVHTSQKTSASINSVGEAEMFRIRERCAGRPVTYAEISVKIRPYLAKHVALHWLFKLGILRH